MTDTDNFQSRIARNRKKHKAAREWVWIAVLIVCLIVGLAILYGLV